MHAYLQQLWSNRNYRIALLILLIFLVWLGSGQLPSAASKQADDAEPVRSITAVKARYVDAQDYAPVIKVRALSGAL